MKSAVVQAPASADVVVDALGTLAPGWQDRAGISHAKRWTTVPMRADAAGRFAPLLARLLGVGVLHWETEPGTFRVTLFQPDGEVIGPPDTADTQALETFAKAFARRELLHATAAVGKERAQWLNEAASASTDPADRHRAFASVLGVPYAEPATPAESNPSTPVHSEASLVAITGPLQRRRRLEQARNVAGFLTVAAAVGAVGSTFQPGWPVNVILIVLTLVLLGTRFWLGSWLKKLQREQQTAP